MTSPSHSNRSSPPPSPPIALDNSGTSPPSPPTRKSARERHTPSRFVARPSRQGLGVADGDAAFLVSALPEESRLDRPDESGRRLSRRLRERKGGKDADGDSEGGRAPPARAARARSILSSNRISNKANAGNEISKPKKSKKRPPPETAPAPDKGSGAPRPPRVIVVGAGISGLACARELSERRHDVLVLEARGRLGGRLRTVDLMTEEVPRRDADGRAGGATEGRGTTHLSGATEWSPVDAGGAFIHGTGVATTGTDADDSPRPGRPPPSEPRRRSSRLSVDRRPPKAARHVRRALNPVYVLADRKLRLPLQAAEGAFTCLADDEGNLIGEEVDAEVSREFNEVLDLAAKCCESGRMPIPREGRGEPPRKGTGGDGAASPNYVSDDTPDNEADDGEGSGPRTAEWQKIDPNTDFGTIFEHCRKYHGASNHRAKSFTPKEMQVRHQLFQWHVANLEMSSGASMDRLGQRWNDDEPFGYGGDHSYLERGFRDIVEALADGFDCRGAGDRRSGDMASSFSTGPFGASSTSPQVRGIIQCGIEVNGVEVVEREQAKMLRKRRRVAKVDLSKCRRSSRGNKGSKMSEIMGSLTTRQPEKLSEGQADETNESGSEMPKSTYGHEESTVVRVTTTCGLTLEADAVVVTLPLAILSIPSGSPGHVAFNPPLSEPKQNALSRLGVGTYNKCCMSFERAFWKHLPRHLGSSSSVVPTYWNDPATHRFDFIGHACNEHGKDILFFNIRNAPILIAIYGGSDYSEEMESMHDEDVVSGCMGVLKKIFSKATDDCRLTRSQIGDLTVPDWPVDYFVSRWGSDPYSRGAFSYVPPGVDGFEELHAMSQPVYDFRPDAFPEDEQIDVPPPRPLIMFAGEATSPCHPSTIHGAFETGIREAYRLDFALEPGLNEFKFDASYLYQPTFTVRPSTTDINREHKTNPGISTTGGMDQPPFTAKEDALILRGVETHSFSSSAFNKIKEHMLSPDSAATAMDIENRFKCLMKMATGETNEPEQFDERKWDLHTNKQKSWLAPVPQCVKKNPTEKRNKPSPNKPVVPVQKEAASLMLQNVMQSRSGRKIQRKTFVDCIQ